MAWRGFERECLGVETIHRRVMGGAADMDRAHTVLVRIQSKAIGNKRAEGRVGGA